MLVSCVPFRHVSKIDGQSGGARIGGDREPCLKGLIKHFKIGSLALLDGAFVVLPDDPRGGFWELLPDQAAQKRRPLFTPHGISHEDFDVKIGLGVAWSKEDPTAARDDIIDIARSLVRAGSEGRGPENRVVCDPSNKRSGLPGTARERALAAALLPAPGSLKVILG